VLTTIRDPRWSILYLLLFGIGTIGGMMLITVALAWPFARAGAGFAGLHRGLRVVSGLVSLVLGAFLAYRVGVIDGLFDASR
jgi:hypothetical protein